MLVCSGGSSQTACLASGWHDQVWGGGGGQHPNCLLGFSPESKHGGNGNGNRSKWKALAHSCWPIAHMASHFHHPSLLPLHLDYGLTLNGQFGCPFTVHHHSLTPPGSPSSHIYCRWPATPPGNPSSSTQAAFACHPLRHARNNTYCQWPTTPPQAPTAAALTAGALMSPPGTPTSSTYC